MAQKTKLTIQVEDGIDVDVVHVPARDPTNNPVIGNPVAVDTVAVPATSPIPYKKGYRWNAAGCLSSPNSLCT
jgi:hypothetical protein